MSTNKESGPRPAVIIDIVARSGGEHCETTALGVLLSCAGLDLSEPMRFGLGAGLSFIYWDSKNQDFPFLGGRVKPFVLTQNLTTRLGLELGEQQTSSPAKAWRQRIWSTLNSKAAESRRAWRVWPERVPLAGRCRPAIDPSR